MFKILYMSNFRDKHITKILGFLSLISLMFVFTIAYIEISKDHISKSKYTDVRLHAYFDGFQYAIIYLNNYKYLQKPPINLEMRYFIDNCLDMKDSLPYDTYYYNGFNYTINYLNKNKFLVKERIILHLDSLKVNCMKQRNFFEQKYKLNTNS